MSYKRDIRRIILLFLLTMIDNVENLTTTSHRHSGLYVDNGQSQTIVHKLKTKQEKLALEHEILKLLGLPEKPKKTNGRAPVMKRSAPKFLLNIYNNTVNEELESVKKNTNDLGEFHLTGQDLQTIEQSDVIISFTAQQNHQGIGGKPDRVKRVWFDIESIPEDNRMMSAELRLYRGPEAKNRKHRGAFAITVYRVLRMTDGGREMQFVDSVNTTELQEGWITLNVTESFQHWLKHPDDNKGFYLSVRPLDRSSRETRPEDIGIVGFTGNAERQPFMVGFFKSSGLRQSRIGQPIVNSIGEDDGLKRNRRSDADDIRELLLNHFKKDENAIPSPTKPCTMKNLYVSFKDLQWQDWIIAPEGYDANYCGGECKFPLNARMNASNHAIVQTLVHLLHPTKAPKPCCAPTKLSAISVLYFLDENNVILKKYKNMVANGCGCH